MCIKIGTLIPIAGSRRDKTPSKMHLANSEGARSTLDKIDSVLDVPRSPCEAHFHENSSHSASYLARSPIPIRPIKVARCTIINSALLGC